MANNKTMTPEEARMQAILNGFLASQAAAGGQGSAGPHLDQDSVAAFAEGNLSEREARPMISHLVDCSFCRHVTAEVIKLNAAFAEQDMSPAAIAEKPAGISEVLSGLFSKIFGTSDGAVFAHNESEEDKTDEIRSDDSDKEKD